MSTPELIDYRVTYGECAGYCTTELRLRGSGLELIQRSTSANDPDLACSGEADCGLVARIEAALAGIDSSELSAVYGKPDSHDEGAATIRLRHDAQVSEHTYSATSPPAELERLHPILSGIVTAWLERDTFDGATFNDFPT